MFSLIIKTSGLTGETSSIQLPSSSVLPPVILRVHIKLTFDGATGYNCRRKDGIVDQNNSLQFLSHLNRARTEFLLREVNSFLNIADPDKTTYESMVLDPIVLDIEYPDFRIDKLHYTFPLADIKDLLEEWLDFLNT